jgi:dTDP-4-dehydrorhamnose reductase
MQTVLITGGAGMLASELATYLSSIPSYHVVALDRSELDVARREEVRGALEAHRPEVVVHTAAMLVEESEESPEDAYRVNAWATRLLAQECQRRGATLVYISTGGVFGDEVRAYHEYDPVVLKTAYARSKHAGEEYVRIYCDRHFVLRLGWLYGGGVERRRSFVIGRYREALGTSVVQSAGDKHGSPTYAADVTRAIPGVLESEAYGLYHLANQGGCTRAQYVRQILQEFGLDTVVEEVDSSHFPRRAPVPDCEILTSFNLGYAGLPSLPPWQEALARYVESIRKQVR